MSMNDYRLYHSAMQENELMHFGILGMKWGVRRYQPYPSGHKGGKEVGEAKKVKPRTEEPNKAKKKNVLQRLSEWSEKHDEEVRKKQIAEIKRQKAETEAAYEIVDKMYENRKNAKTLRGKLSAQVGTKAAQSRAEAMANYEKKYADALDENSRSRENHERQARNWTYKAEAYANGSSIMSAKYETARGKDSTVGKEMAKSMMVQLGAYMVDDLVKTAVNRRKKS